MKKKKNNIFSLIDYFTYPFSGYPGRLLTYTELIFISTIIKENFNG